MTDVLLVLGDQLFDPALLPVQAPRQVFMAEDRGLCTAWRIHTHKLLLFLGAMRAYADELRTASFTVDYRRIDDDREWQRDFLVKLGDGLSSAGAKRLWHYEIADRSFAAVVAAWCAANGITQTILPSPSFLTPSADGAQWLVGRKQARMADFYTWQRRRLGVLVDGNDGPVGGRWSYDADNRQPVPKGLIAPVPPRVQPNPHLPALVAAVRHRFPDHPGDPGTFALPTTRSGARAWLKDFCTRRLALFGPYEDALSTDQDILYHSMLAPLMNLGLLTPREVIDAALAQPDVPLNSLEGFIRQVIGWREFVKAVDASWGDRQAAANAWGAHRRPASCWRDGTTGIPPLDQAIAKAGRLAWTHHIERLMVLGNAFQLCEIAPGEVFRWFMETHCDSAEWVMGPNVFGMALGCDGGLMMTKPYICGSPYLRRMGKWSAGDWCDELDGLYWRFVSRHATELRSNPRTAQAVATLARMGAERRERLEQAAAKALARLTVP